MIKITIDEIKQIDEENSFISFLSEKLKLPIPERLSLEDITIRYSNYALGLSGNSSEQVLACKELILLPGKSSGIFLISFRSEPGYAGILHQIADGLGQIGNELSVLLFVCIEENYQPFAIAYFKDIDSPDGNRKKLHILAWTEDSSHMFISSEHDIPIDFFNIETSAIQFKNNMGGKDTTNGDTASDEIKGNTGKDLPSHLDIPKIQSDQLLSKLKNAGQPLGQYYDIHTGVTPGSVDAFVIDEEHYQEFINEDLKYRSILIPIVRNPKNKKWHLEPAYLIWFANSDHKQWPWSLTEEESQAEKIFAKNYPAICNHLSTYKEKLVNRNEDLKGKFYWELATREPIPKNYKEVYRPKIVYPVIGTNMRAFYDITDGYILGSTYCIPTNDLSLIAILNSTLFNWYAKAMFQIAPNKSGLSFTKKKMNQVPIMPMPEHKKNQLSELVRIILDDSSPSGVTMIENEIDSLICELYQLTDIELDLISA